LGRYLGRSKPQQQDSVQSCNASERKSSTEEADATDVLAIDKGLAQGSEAGDCESEPFMGFRINPFNSAIT
jgi:hypothetical protein